MKPLLLALLLCSAAPAFGDASFDSAVSLYHDRRYPEARAAFDKIVAADPANAAACHYLGLILQRYAGPDALDDSLPWFEKAVALAPDNSEYVGDYGGTCLLLARKHYSYSYATKGRDAMLKAITLNPDNIEARYGLMEFYQRAPWPLNDEDKAYAQAGEIRKRDIVRGTFALSSLYVSDKKFEEAFQLCDGFLRSHPEAKSVLFQLGWVCNKAGKHLDHGESALKDYLTYTPGSSDPQPYQAHWQLGLIYAQQFRRDDARAEYQAALKLNPDFKPAADALVKLK